MTCSDYKTLEKQRQFFSPQFPSSIAWTPKPRQELETLLKSKPGIWSEKGQRKTVFHSGLLNKIYFTLDGLLPSQVKDPISYEIGEQNKETLKEGLVYSPLSSALNPSRLTGGGTNQDNDSVLNRHAWPWTEERLGGRTRGGVWKRVRSFLAIDPYMVNDHLQDVCIYARLISDGSGAFRYEVENNNNQQVPRQDS
jgi:hypothetical protein